MSQPKSVMKLHFPERTETHWISAPSKTEWEWISSSDSASTPVGSSAFSREPSSFFQDDLQVMQLDIHTLSSFLASEKSGSMPSERTRSDGDVHSPHSQSDTLLGLHSFSKIAMKIAQDEFQTSNLVSFHTTDPINPSNAVEGIMCRQTGKYDGSLIIYCVNGLLLKKPIIVHSTPKVVYPYKSYDDLSLRDFKDEEFNGCTMYYLSNKWNGTNVVVFKYEDAHGNVFVSAKTKGTVFLQDSIHGNFLSLSLEAITGSAHQGIHYDDLPPCLLPLCQEDVQAISFELCGSRLKHLVYYDVPLMLHPLFYISPSGRIKPHISEGKRSVGPFPFIADGLTCVIKRLRNADYEMNERHRSKNGLLRRYEHDYYICEGYVLYLLDPDGYVLDRSLYKIKPADIEAIHWTKFDGAYQQKVREALEKCYVRNRPFCEATIRDEMDVGELEWSRFGKNIMSYAELVYPSIGYIPRVYDDHRKVYVLVGLHFSGKTFFINQFMHYLDAEKRRQWQVVNQVEELESALLKNQSVIVEISTSIKRKERRFIINCCRKYAILDITCLYFNCPRKIIKARAKQNISEGQAYSATKSGVCANIQPPQKKEGFNQVITIVDDQSQREVIVELGK